MSVDSLLSEAAVLHEALKLYFEPRILRVHPSEEVATLRRLIWAVSAGTLHRTVVAGERAVPVILLPSEVPTLNRLGEVIRGGETVGGTDSIGDCTGRSTLARLRSALQTGQQFLEEATVCCSFAGAQQLMLRASELQRVVDLRGEFATARLQCMVRPASRYARSTKSNSDSTCAAATTADQSQEKGLNYDSSWTEMLTDAPATASTEVETASTTQTAAPTQVDVEYTADSEYCFCRGEDDGSTMICCDGCDEWFHSRCVRAGGKQRSAAKKKVKTASGASKPVEEETAGFMCISCCAHSGEEYAFKW